MLILGEASCGSEGAVRGFDKGFTVLTELQLFMPFIESREESTWKGGVPGSSFEICEHVCVSEQDSLRISYTLQD